MRKIPIQIYLDQEDIDWLNSIFKKSKLIKSKNEIVRSCIQLGRNFVSGNEFSFTTLSLIKDKKYND